MSPMKFLNDAKGLSLAGFVAGAVASLGFAPLEVGLFTAVGLIGLFGILDKAQGRPTKEHFAVGFSWGLGYFAFGLSWVIDSMYRVAGIPYLVALLGLIALSAAAALFTGVFAFLVAQFKGPRLYRLAFICPTLFTLLEFVRGDLLTSFGWLNPGYAFAGNILGAWAPIAGLYAVTWILLFFASSVYVLLTTSWTEMKKAEARIEKRRFLIVFFIFGALALGTYGVSELTWVKGQRQLEVRLVQADLPVLMHPTMKAQTEALTRVEAMSGVAPMGRNPDFIVWSESVYATSLQRLDRSMIETPLRVSKKMQAPVLFNAFNEPQKGDFYNAAWIADADTKPVLFKPFYAKRHLVPFGEYVPWGFRWFVEALNIPMVDQKRGVSCVLPFEMAGVKVAYGICYENLFGAELRTWFEKDSPHVVIYSVNLAWFGDAVHRQYVAMSAMRAREVARPVLLCANSANSALILPDGTVDRLARPGAQTFDVSLRRYEGNPTPFVRFGSWPVISFLILVLIGFFVRFIGKEEGGNP